MSPYYIVCEDRPVGSPVSVRRVHAGFDVDIYGIQMSREPDPAAEYWFVYTQLKEVVDVVRHEYSHACSIEVIPFGSTIVFDTKDHLKPMAMLRIRIAHSRGMHETAGQPSKKPCKPSRPSSASWELLKTGGERKPELVTTRRHLPRQRAD